MDLNSISLDPIRAKTVAILGYGNQGRAQALNLRDSGVQVRIGARAGTGASLAQKDGFTVEPFETAISGSDIVMYLFPDQVIPQIYEVTKRFLKPLQAIGFAHGFCYHFEWIKPLAECRYFLVGSKGAGAVLRDAFERGGGLPGVYAIDCEDEKFETLIQSYAKAIGLANQTLLKTTFQEETECDLFGEQTVLCGGLPQLMETAFETLVEAGFSREMAFLECCYEAKTIVELWIKNGPYEMTKKISPTAFYGGLISGKRMVNGQTKIEMKKILQEIQSGEFAKKWKAEVDNGTPQLIAERERLKKSQLDKTYLSLPVTATV